MEIADIRETILPWRVVFLLTLSAITLAVQSQQPDGFVSIDCGLPANATYVDEGTNLTFISDAQFVNSGLVANISSHFVSTNLCKEFLTVRYFPKFRVNCYTLAAVKIGLKYLISALFNYGNYDNLNKPPSFDIYLGLEYWDSVNASDLSHPEMILIAPADNLQLCLINTDEGVPFISSIHLRQLDSNIYPMVNNSTYPLGLNWRYNLGASSRPSVRYPDDMYERWWSNYSQESWMEISTNSSVIPDASFKTPSLVMQTAATTSSTEEALSINGNTRETTYYAGPSFLLVLHFAEIKNLSMTDRREFSITVNGEQKFPDYTPPLLASDSINFTNMGNPNTYVCSLEATSNSTLPPLLNAIELYLQFQYSYIPTHRQDVAAISSITEYYKVESWLNMSINADPCILYTTQWSDDHIDCDYGYTFISMNTTTVVTKLNLSSVGMTGRLIDTFGNLTSLKSLDLSGNNLSGSLPDSLDKLTALEELYINGNSKLETTLPPKLHRKYEDQILKYRFDPPPADSKKNIIIIAVAVVVPLVVLIAGAVAALLCLRNRKHYGNYGGQKWEGGENLPKLESRQFSYNDLRRITNSFKNSIGEGGFGSVYLGIMEDGVQVAVKMHSNSSSQGVKELLAEAESLTRVHHRNLVALIGYCIDKNCMALVYEYMQKGNLHDKLKDNDTPLAWEQRLRIAYESALGLEYLHKACNPPLIHRDVKTSNILLNANLEAKIADFGLSKVYNNTAISHVSTRVVGTPGYLDPEYYLSHGQLTVKSDVYGFGVVLLEIITGRPPLMAGPEGESLIKWVHQKLSEGNIESIVDPRMKSKYDINSIWKVTNLACKCIELTSSERPTMAEVAAELKESLDLEISTETMHNSDTDILLTNVSQVSAVEIPYIGDIMLAPGPTVR